MTGSFTEAEARHLGGQPLGRLSIAGRGAGVVATPG